MNTFINSECNFVSQDTKEYNYDFDFRIVEFVVKDGVMGGLVISNPTKTKRGYTYKQDYSYVYEIPKDGWYKYYKIIVMSCQSIEDTTKAIYVDCDSRLIFNNEEIKDFSIIDGIIENKAAGLLNAEMYEFFTICKLKQCIKSLQMKIFLDGINSCGGKYGSNCNTMKSDRTNRDFLFSTYWILNELICQGEYDKAQAILDKFNSSCGSLCEEVEKDIENCGCKNL